jgi:hypothetical protein
VTGERFPCPVCGYLTLTDAPGRYDICPVCFWEDDPVQARDPDYAGGPNRVSLKEAKRNFAAFGASKERSRGNVRPPHPDEIPPR